MTVFMTLKSIQCMHFEENSGVWKTSGCSVANSTTDTTVCRCDRVAQFGVSEMPISTELSFQRVPVCCVSILYRVLTCSSIAVVIHVLISRRLHSCKKLFIDEYRVIILAASSSKRNVTVWRPSVCMSVCLSVPFFFLTLIQRAAHTQRTHREQHATRPVHTFRPANKEDRHIPVAIK